MPNKEGNQTQVKEDPRGLELARKVTEMAILSLTQTYPILENPLYAARIPRTGDIYFRSIEALHEIEEKEIPQTAKHPFNDALRKAGLSQFTTYNRQVNDEEQIYWNPDGKRRMYLGKSFLEGLSDKNMGKRGEAASFLGIWIINKALACLPVSREIIGNEKDDWEEVIKADMKNLEEKSDINPEILLTIQQIIEKFALNEPNSKIIAHGGKVAVTLPGETPMYPAYLMGAEFNYGLIHILANPACIKLLNLLRSEKIISTTYLTAKQTESEMYAEEILRDYQKNLLKDDNSALVAAFADSSLPQSYYKSLMLVNNVITGALPHIKKSALLEYPR